jgi:opacity protein-like surface antigen
MRVSFALPSLALLAVGCATESVGMRAAPDLSVAGLASPTSTDSNGWTEIDPATTVARPAAGRTVASAEAWEHHVTAMAGQRFLDDSEWDDLDDPLAFGVEFDGTEVASGNGFEVGTMYTNQDDDIGSIDAEATTFEIYAGYRYTFFPEEEGFHPFLSVGLDALRGELDIDGFGSEDDLTYGAYARAGVLWDVSDRMRLGVDYRHLFADDLDLDFGPGGNLRVDPDYDQLVLSFGWCY